MFKIETAPGDIIAADFYKARKGATLLINRIRHGQRTLLRELAVADKREARKVAAEHGAKPWNF